MYSVECMLVVAVSKVDVVACEDASVLLCL